MNLCTFSAEWFSLFSTWRSLKTYPKKYRSQNIEKIEDEIELINKAYKMLAEDCDLIKSDNGTKLHEIELKYPEINLYEDTSHPNKYGAFLNACVFFELITGEKPSYLKYSGIIEPEIAQKLKDIVH